MTRIRISRRAFGVKALAIVASDERFTLINVYGLGLWIFKDERLFRMYQELDRMEV